MLPVASYVAVGIVFSVVTNLAFAGAAKTQILHLHSSGYGVTDPAEYFGKSVWAVSTALNMVTILSVTAAAAGVVFRFTRLLLFFGILVIACLIGYFAYKTTFITETNVIISLMRFAPMVTTKDVVTAMVAVGTFYQVVAVSCMLTDTETLRGNPRALQNRHAELRGMLYLGALALASSVFFVRTTHFWPLDQLADKSELESVAKGVVLYAGMQSTIYLVAIYGPALIVLNRVARGFAGLRRGIEIPAAVPTGSRDLRGLKGPVGLLAMLAPLLAEPLAQILSTIIAQLDKLGS